MNSHHILVYAAQPREGTETELSLVILTGSFVPGLCSSTPRGDGNPYASVGSKFANPLVYAAQPREGTETYLLTPEFHIGVIVVVYAAQPREGTETRVLCHQSCA